MLTPEDQSRIAQAVATAEAKTAGEIYCVLTPRASEYREVPLAWACVAALALPPLALLLGFRPRALEALFGGWTIGQDGAVGATVLSAVSAYIVLQAAVLVAALLLLSIPAVRRAVTPSGLAAERVRRAALDQFLGHGLHLTRDRTGVLIFAALEERRAEVIADEGIYAAAPPEVWDEVVGLLVAGLKRGEAAEGFVAAVTRSGEILAEHVPPRGGNPNELSDRIVILDPEAPARA
ncbi:MAG TPA: TPM domain-containing protein [Caulobacter sp.]|nr:TPM domain-containing protein [Caulobacter sp.]